MFIAIQANIGTVTSLPFGINIDLILDVKHYFQFNDTLS